MSPEECRIRFTGWSPDGPLQYMDFLTPFGDIPGHTINQLKLSLSKSQVSVVCTRHEDVNSCRKVLAEVVGISPLPWSDYWERSNGYFNCEVNKDENGAACGITTSTLFEAKYIATSGREYCWVRFNFITYWIASTRQTIIIILEGPSDFEESVHQLVANGIDEQKLRDPFWPFELALDKVVCVFDKSVWGVRDAVRSLERTEIPVQEKPKPDYRRLHDLARHAIHVSETLDVSTETIAQITRHYEDILQADAGGRDEYWSNNTHRRLRFFSNILCSLKSRSESNRQRLLNEIQLAIHTVSQYDSGVSVEITQSDSSAMKSVAFVTLTFFPATIVSSIFSMEFWNFNPDATDTWVLSDKFWLYWAFTIPLTLVTSAICVYLRIVPSLGLGTWNRSRRNECAYNHNAELKDGILSV